MAIVFRISLFILAIFVAGLLAYILFVAWLFHYGVEAERATFSSEAWKATANVYASSNDPGCVRGGLALDVVATGMLRGKLFEDVESLLGEPDGKQEGEPYYELGQCSGLGWHDSVLQVNFYNEPHVVDVEILRHKP